jgi:hypothetical protein
MYFNIVEWAGAHFFVGEAKNSRQNGRRIRRQMGQKAAGVMGR